MCPSFSPSSLGVGGWLLELISGKSHPPLPLPLVYLSSSYLSCSISSRGTSLENVWTGSENMPSHCTRQHEQHGVHQTSSPPRCPPSHRTHRELTASPLKLPLHKLCQSPPENFNESALSETRQKVSDGERGRRSVCSVLYCLRTVRR